MNSLDFREEMKKIVFPLAKLADAERDELSWAALMELAGRAKELVALDK